MVRLVVLLRGDGTEADLRWTVDAVERHTPDLGVCLFDPDADDADAMLEAALARDHDVLLFVSETGSGTLGDQLAWEVVQRALDADVALLELGGAVGPDWHERLRSAAYEDTIVATSSAVPTAMLTLHDRPSTGLHLADDGSVRGAALGEPLWGCVYIRRDALNIAMGARWTADDRQRASPRPIEEVVLVPGFVHVVAAAIVVSTAERSLQGPRSALTSAARRVLAEMEAAVEPLRVTVDLRCCEYPLSGTQVHALNLATSLAAHEAVRLSILLPARVDESVQPHLDALPSSVSRHTSGRRIIPEPHVFHRPYQILTENEITDVVTAGVRLVVTHQDMILDRTPAYFRSRDQWRHYIAATALSFVAADEVVFFSEHARREAVRDGLVDHVKTSVVPPGTNHYADGGDEVVPRALRDRMASARPAFVLVIGNAYFHKNRLFALRVTEELRSAHGWDGATVFAGGKPEAGSSSDDERELLGDHEELSARFVDLPRVSDAERRWLYRNAAMVLFPTLYEGFGLIPFEAAGAGTPCVYSSRSSVAEYLPPEGALLDLGDVAETARRVIAVLRSADVREDIVRAIRSAGDELTWRRAADSYVDVYRRAMARPVGLSLVSGKEVIVGATSQMVASETERRVLVGLRRSTVVRGIAEAVVGAAVVVRRGVRRLSRPGA